MLDPEQLRTFLHVFDTGSLVAACRRAHLTQPALSRHIRLLEEQLKTILFERTGRGMLPTLDALKLEPQVRKLLSQLENLAYEFDSTPVRGPVSLAVTPSIGMGWTAQILQGYLALYPEARLSTTVMLSGAIGPAVAAGQFDVGVLYSPTHSSLLTIQDLWDERTYLVCRPQLLPTLSVNTSSARRTPKIQLRDVIAAPLVLPSSESGIVALLEGEARKLGVSLSSKITVDSVQLALELVRQGDFAMVLTSRALSDIRARKLCALPIVRPALSRSAQLVATDQALSRPVVRALWDLVVESAQTRLIEA